MKIILASGSTTRKIMMDAFGVPYSIVPANIDEKAIRDGNLKIQAEKITRAKAENVLKGNDGIIIAADTFGSFKGHILEKPQSLKEAREMLKLQSNRKCTMYTGFCYIDKANNINYSNTAVSKYTFRKLSDEEINKFVENNPVLKWSAAFAPLDPYQVGFIDQIEGSMTGLMYGLPAEFLIPCLEKSGVKLFSK
jgi:septum formation protein